MQSTPSSIVRTLVTLAVLCAPSAAQTTWYVSAAAAPPGNGSQAQPYASIQYAIAQPTTVPGDTIFVGPGTYERINFNGKDLRVRSSDGPATTIIDAANWDSCVRFSNGGGGTTSLATLVEGFTLRHGNAPYGGGVQLVSSSATIRNCFIVDNLAGSDGGGVHAYFSQVAIEHCVIARNRALHYGGGVGLNASSGSSIRRCTIASNDASSAGAIDLRSQSGTPVFDSILWGNESPQIQYQGGTGAALRYCDVEGGANGAAIMYADPRFTDAAAGDWTLTSISPCIDAGDPTSLYDLDGTRSDMGAFPFASEVGGASRYCTSGTTANGCTATISAVGSPSVSASSGFTISVLGVEGVRPGLVFYGIHGGVALPWASGSSSFLCVKTPTQRTNVQSSGGTLNSCNGSFSLDWCAYAAANSNALGQPFTAGQVINAQAWFRDPPSPKTTSLSDAIEFALSY